MKNRHLLRDRTSGWEQVLRGSASERSRAFLLVSDDSSSTSLSVSYPLDSRSSSESISVKTLTRLLGKLCNEFGNGRLHFPRSVEAESANQDFNGLGVACGGSLRTLVRSRRAFLCGILSVEDIWMDAILFGRRVSKCVAEQGRMDKLRVGRDATGSAPSTTPNKK